MLLKLIRELCYCNERQTQGNLFVNNAPFCSTIEPPLRGNATHKKGAIPKGWYRVRVTYSPKFKRAMPLVYMVPGFEGIRIHAGLRVENTQGCICVGERWKEERLTELLTKTQEKNEEIYICITDSDSVDGRLSQSADPDRGTFGY